MHKDHRTRVKNRFLAEGLDHFEELHALELLLFFAVPRDDVNPRAHRLLERFGKLPAMIAGQFICYLCGSLWFYLYAGGGLWLILVRCVLPYLLPDALKVALAYTLSRRLARHIT